MTVWGRGSLYDDAAPTAPNAGQLRFVGFLMSGRTALLSPDVAFHNTRLALKVTPTSPCPWVPS